MGGRGRAGGGRGQRSSCPWSIPAWRLPGPHGLELGHEQDPSPEILVNAGASSGGAAYALASLDPHKYLYNVSTLYRALCSVHS